MPCRLARRVRCALAGMGAAALLVPQMGVAQESVSFVTVPFPPYFGPDLPDKGFTAAIARAAFDREGYSYELTFQPWTRAIASAKAGEFDGVHGAFYSDERAADFRFSERALFTVRTVLIAGTDFPRDSYDGIADLMDYRIGTFQDYAYPEPFNSASELKKESSPNRKRNLVKLRAGRLDLVAGGQAVLLTVARDSPRFEADKLKVLEPPLGVQDLLLITPEDNPDGQAILQAFDRGIAAIQEDGTFAEILRDYGIR